MLIFYIGTRAQIIKLAPVILEAEKRKLPVKLIYTGQHQETMLELSEDFGINTPKDYIYSGPEITGVIQMAKWFVYCMWKIHRDTGRYVSSAPAENDILIVHGDTFSTLLGAIVGRLYKVKVAHIEAGLRSFNIFHPFPEELTRLLTFRLSNIAYCPGDWAYKNMKRYDLERVNTVSNTLLDALNYAKKRNECENSEQNSKQYGICSIHRFENIFNKKRLEKIIKLVEIATNSYEITFVLHPATKKKLEKFGLLYKLSQNKNIRLEGRMGYIKFINLIQNARFVITDGGGNQEELSYLGIPTCLMRKKTERQEGLNSTVTICNYDENVMKKFLSSLHENHPATKTISGLSPSSIIIDSLEKTLSGN